MEKEVTIRDLIFNKYNGLCAYTGKELDSDWQINHLIPKKTIGNDELPNLVPTLKVIDRYKRSYDIEGFREFMQTFHIRLSSLPKKTRVARKKRRIAYLTAIAEAFGITEDKPFSGKFYFETLEN